MEKQARRTEEEEDRLEEVAMGLEQHLFWHAWTPESAEPRFAKPEYHRLT